MDRTTSIGIIALFVIAALAINFHLVNTTF